MPVSLAGILEQLKRRSLVGQVVVVLVGAQILSFGSFVCLDLPTATQRNMLAFLRNQAVVATQALPERAQARVRQAVPRLAAPAGEVRVSRYVPVVPLSVFIGYILGSALGLTAATLYLGAGLVGPCLGIYLFAAGGGVSYYQQPGFGYLLGMAAASYCAGWATSKRRTSFRQLLAAVTGVGAAHGVGLAYLLGSCLVSILFDGASSFPGWRPWVFEQARNLTWYPLPYDLLFSFALIGVGFPFRWLVRTLIAPDMGVRPRGQQRIEDLV